MGVVCFVHAKRKERRLHDQDESLGDRILMYINSLSFSRQDVIVWWGASEVKIKKQVG